MIYLKQTLASILVFLAFHIYADEKKAYIIADQFGGVGNSLFQVATASALAWDHNSEAYFPHLALVPTLNHHFFSRCKVMPPSQEIEFEWEEIDFAFQTIPYHPKMHLRGHFQSYKFFEHHREKLLQLFAPCSNDMIYMTKKYDWLIKHPKTVGVQIKHYNINDPIGNFYYHDFDIKDYLEKAMSLFSDDYLFVINTDNIEYAKQNIPSWVKNIYFLENERYYIQFFLLSFCKHNIISDSKFGWWTAWLNKNPDKIVIRPSCWNHEYPEADVFPENWIIVQ